MISSYVFQQIFEFEDSTHPLIKILISLRQVHETDVDKGGKKLDVDLRTTKQT